MKKRTGLLLAIAMLAACPSPYSADGYCHHAAEQQCAFWYRCCTAAERFELAGIFYLFGSAHTNESECREELSKTLCASFEVYSESVRAGRGEWDESRMQECMSGVEQGVRECDATKYYTSMDTDSCQFDGQIFKGKVSDGGECFFDGECTSDTASCVKKTSDDPNKELKTARGTCKGPPTAGESCDNGACATGHYCDSSQVCRAQLANSNVCQSDGECQSDRCEYDSSSGDYLCLAKIATGQACAYHSECESGNCDSSNDTCASKLANGSACDSDSQCTSGNCDYNSNTCKPALSDEAATVYDICTGNPNAPLVSLATEPVPASFPQ